MFKERAKIQSNKGLINMWAAYFYDQQKGDKDKILTKLDFTCRDRFSNYSSEDEDYILNLIEKIGDSYYAN